MLGRRCAGTGLRAAQIDQQCSDRRTAQHDGNQSAAAKDRESARDGRYRRPKGKLHRAHQGRCGARQLALVLQDRKKRLSWRMCT